MRPWRAGRARRRFPRRPPLRIGLTGSIGMGKSTVAAMFAASGVPTFDADACVRRLTGPGGAALPAIERAFPGMTGPAGMDRAAMGRLAFADAAALARLEALLHPLVRAAEDRFFRRAALSGRGLALSDVPLLFETGAEARFDVVVVVGAPAAVQRARVMRRPGMSAERLAAILARQWPDRAKRRAADRVIATGLGKAPSRRQVRRLVRELQRGPGDGMQGGG
ncbi:MAG: dephospho-CoA kinase [Alphaproteobacteria bacterium]